MLVRLHGYWNRRPIRYSRADSVADSVFSSRFGGRFGILGPIRYSNVPDVVNGDSKTSIFIVFFSTINSFLFLKARIIGDFKRGNIGRNFDGRILRFFLHLVAYLYLYESWEAIFWKSNSFQKKYKKIKKIRNFSNFFEKTLRERHKN